MTKSELEIKVSELKKQIEENKHLATTIEAKDKEIAILKGNHNKEIEKLKEDLRKSYEEIIATKEKEIENLNKQQEDKINKAIAPLTRQIENLQNALQRRSAELNHLIVIYGNLLKSMQGTLDNAIEINDYFINEVNN